MSSQNTPLVSIVLTTLNAATYLRESIESCLHQSYPNIELIVVDGGSTDKTIEIVQEYPEIGLIHQIDNAGKLPGAINHGLDHARGEYLTWMQADSIYHLDAIKKMSECLVIHPEVGHVYADYWVIDQEGCIQDIVHTCEPEEILKAKADPCGVCFMIRQSTREMVGAHDVNAYPTQDYDYRLRIALKFPSCHIQEPLYYWRIHPFSLTGSRPWTIDARNDARIRQKLGISNKRQTTIDLAAIDMAWAFERYKDKDYDEVPKFILSGLQRNLAYIWNKGVWSVLFKSLIKK